MNFVEDLDIRLHHRSKMESAGLQRIIILCQGFGVTRIDKQLRLLQDILDEDEKRLRERLDKEILRDLANPQDVYDAIRSKTQDTKASDYFLSMMQHLLLIREDGAPMVHYYQLIDSLITDVVLDEKLAGAEQRIGRSVKRIFAQFNEADRCQAAEQEAAVFRGQVVRLNLEKEVLEQEVAQGQDGLVGQLKEKIANLEDKLAISRETTSKFQSQLEAQKSGYEEQIGQLEAQIMELFRMLKEVGSGVDNILDTGSLDRKSLVQTLEKHFQRTKTISILEGRERRHRKRGTSSGVDFEDEADTDVTPRKASLKRVSKSTSKKTPKRSKSGRASETQTGRVSQFMDADEADVQQQIQKQLAAGVTIVRDSLLLAGSH
jgi:cytokinesis protein